MSRVIESLSMLSNFRKTEFIRDSGGNESLLAVNGREKRN